MNREATEARIKNLPPLPLVAQKLVTLLQDDDCSAADVTRVLSSDQALAGKILKLANSSFYGLSGRVGSVSRAVVILGFSAIRSMALGLGIAQSMKAAGGDLDLDYFWRHALFTAAATRTVAEECEIVDAEEAFVAGLVHDLGWLVIELAHPGLLASLAELPLEQRIDAEVRAAGLPHTKAGQRVMRRWKLPEALGHTARFHHHPTHFQSDEGGLVGLVQMGEHLAHALGRNSKSGQAEPDPVELAKRFGISPRKTRRLLDDTMAQVHQTSAFLEVAGIEIEFDDGSSCSESQGSAVYLGTDADRAAWVGGLLGAHGWQPVPMRPFLSGDAGEVDLVIADPRAIAPEQALKLRTALEGRGVPVATLGPSKELAGIWLDADELSPSFNAAELALACKGVAV